MGNFHTVNHNGPLAFSLSTPDCIANWPVSFDDTRFMYASMLLGYISAAKHALKSCEDAKRVIQGDNYEPCTATPCTPIVLKTSLLQSVGEIVCPMLCDSPQIVCGGSTSEVNSFSAFDALRLIGDLMPDPSDATDPSPHDKCSRSVIECKGLPFAKVEDPKNISDLSIRISATLAPIGTSNNVNSMCIDDSRMEENVLDTNDTRTDCVNEEKKEEYGSSLQLSTRISFINSINRYNSARGTSERNNAWATLLKKARQWHNTRFIDNEGNCRRKINVERKNAYPIRTYSKQLLMSRMSYIFWTYRILFELNHAYASLDDAGLSFSASHPLEEIKKKLKSKSSQSVRGVCNTSSEVLGFISKESPGNDSARNEVSHSIWENIDSKPYNSLMLSPHRKSATRTVEELNKDVTNIVYPHPMVEFPMANESIFEARVDENGEMNPLTASCSNRPPNHDKDSKKRVKKHRRRKPKKNSRAPGDPTTSVDTLGPSKSGPRESKMETLFPWVESPKYTEPFRPSPDCFEESSPESNSLDLSSIFDEITGSQNIEDTDTKTQFVSGTPLDDLILPNIASPGCSPRSTDLNPQQNKKAVQSESIDDMKSTVHNVSWNQCPLPSPLPIPSQIPCLPVSDSPIVIPDLSAPVGLINPIELSSNPFSFEEYNGNSPGRDPGSSSLFSIPGSPVLGLRQNEPPTVPKMDIRCTLGHQTETKVSKKKKKRKRRRSVENGVTGDHPPKKKIPRKRRREKSLTFFPKCRIDMPTMKTAHRWKRPDGLYYCKLPGCEHRSGVKSAANLRQHYKNHTQEKLMCPHCYDLFSSKGSLNTHCRTQHSENPVDFDTSPDPAFPKDMMHIRNTAEELEALFCLR